jgi:hypothetical protein
MKLVLGYDPMSVKEGLKIALSGIGRGITSPTVRRRNSTAANAASAAVRLSFRIENEVGDGV